VRVLYFGTYERTYPRNAQVIAALRRADVDVVEHHVSVWEGREHKWAVGAGAVLRVASAQLRLARRAPAGTDAVVVGYPGHGDMPLARLVAGRRPLVFNPLVSLADTFVDDRARFAPGSTAARALAAADHVALRLADLVVADTDAHADFLAAATHLPRERVATAYVGAEDAVFGAGWRPDEPFSALFVGKLIPLHGLETILAAAALVPELPIRLVGSGQLEHLLAGRPENVGWEPWLPYRELPAAYHAAGCALGIFGTSAKAGRVIPNKAFQALACATPLVTADTPAARELLTDGQDALLVPPGDPEALAAALRRLANEDGLAARLAAAGRATYEERASEPVLGRRWRELIEGAAR
jgi:glycosyltransferase involved in cell wall biosynthesis